MRSNIRFLQVANVLGFLAVIIMNVLSEVLPVNGVTTADISGRYENLFTPAGFTFSIWSVIYLALLGFVIYQSKGLFQKGLNQSKTIVAQLGLVFLISCIANIFWLYAWHYQEFTITIILMALLLLSLIDLNRRIFSMQKSIDKTRQFTWFVKIPFGLYLGWICVATIANVAVLLKSEDWQQLGISEHAWAIIMVFVAGLIGLMLLIKWRLVSAAAVIAWGIFGILYKNMSGDVDLILNVVMVVMIIVLMIGIVSFGINKKNVED